MVYRHRRSKVLSVLAGLTMVAATFPVGGSLTGYQAEAAGVPPAFAQGFSEIVKAVTPAVVNIAVTGGGEGRRKVVANSRLVDPSADRLPVKSLPAWNRRALRVDLRNADRIGRIRAPAPALFWIRTAIL